MALRATRENMVGMTWKLVDLVVAVMAAVMAMAGEFAIVIAVFVLYFIAVLAYRFAAMQKSSPTKGEQESANVIPILKSRDSI